MITYALYIIENYSERRYTTYTPCAFTINISHTVYNC